MAYLFLLPWFLGLVFFQIGPIVASLILSFTDYQVGFDSHWVGLQNYKEMFLDDRDFVNSLGVTLKYLALSVPLYMVTGLALSLLLNVRLRGINVFRTIVFVPSVLSGVAVAILWSSLLNPDLGPVNGVLRAIGIDNPPLWIVSPTWAIPSLVLLGLWGVGANAIIYLAGLQNIPQELHEAARIDGARTFRRFWHITLPLLTPTLLFVLLTSLVAAFQVFDTAFVLGSQVRQLGISDYLRVYLLNLWIEAFSNGRIGYAAGLAWLLIVMSGIVIFVLFKTAGRWVYYEYDPGREE